MQVAAVVGLEEETPEMKNSGKSDVEEEQKKWLQESFWPIPCWLKEDCSKVEYKDYDSFLKYNLRTRYLELEGDFRNAFSNYCHCPSTDLMAATRIVELLKAAKEALQGKKEANKVNLPSIANVLDLIERYMIWICPYEVVRQKVNILAARLHASRPTCSTLLCSAAKECDGEVKHIGVLRATYDEVIASINSENISNHINYGLQIERLRMLKFWGVCIALVTILFSPLLMDYSANAVQMTFPVPILLQGTFLESPLFKGWLMITTLAIFGGIGGFVSGLLQIRNSQVDLQKYRESVLKFQLKPLVGCITASLICLLLTWRILPGIDIKSIGTLILIAFVTGFSERHFLRLINIEEKKSFGEAGNKPNEHPISSSK
jgi:hypothetical protein